MSRYVDAEVMPCGELWDNLTDIEKTNVLTFLLKMPTADVVERKRGEWETSREIDWDGNLVYDHFHRDCGHTYTNHLERGANFCPNCGADMRERKET